MLFNAPAAMPRPLSATAITTSRLPAVAFTDLHSTYRRTQPWAVNLIAL